MSKPRTPKPRKWSPEMVAMGPGRWAVRLCNRCNAEIDGPRCRACSNPEFRLVEIPVAGDPETPNQPPSGGTNP